MVTRRLRLRDGGRPSARPGWLLGLTGKSTSRAPVSSGGIRVPGVRGSEVSGLLEGRRRRRGFAGRAAGPVGCWAAADRTSDEGEESELPAEEIVVESRGKGRSGASEAKVWKGVLLARSIDGICPVPWLLRRTR